MADYSLDNISTFNQSMRRKTLWNSLWNRRKFNESFRDKNEHLYSKTQYFVLDHILMAQDGLLGEFVKQMGVLNGREYSDAESHGSLYLSGFTKEHLFTYGVKSELRGRKRAPSTSKLIEILCEAGIQMSELYQRPIHIIPPERFNGTNILVFDETMNIEDLGEVVVPIDYYDIVQSGNSLVRLIGGKSKRDEVKSYLPE